MSDLARREVAKYQAAWSRPEYRTVAPGEQETRRAWSLMGCARGITLNDYGSGTGRPAQWFADQGADVLGIDFADNANETGVTVQIANLWDMPEVRGADFGFCTDVMEHIPPEHVGDVLAGIADKTRKAAYFRIALFHDGFSREFGSEPLHLTVEGADWWLDRLRAHFKTVEKVAASGGNLVAIGWQSKQPVRIKSKTEGGAVGNIWYEPHPVSKERLAELRGKGYRVVDAQFRPPEAEAPSDPHVPTREEIADMKRKDVVEYLQAHGVDDPKGNLKALRDTLERIIYL